MARLSDRRLVEALARRFEPEIRDAFLRSIRSITSTVTIRIVAERLERGDVAGAMEALGLDPEAFAPLDRAIAEAYYGAGQAQVENWPLVRDPDGGLVVFRFGVRNNAAEAWLRQHSATLVTRANEDMIAGLRFHFSEGLARGRNPRQTAIQVAGRYNRATGRREGGLIGLTSPQMRYVDNPRWEVDPENEAPGARQELLSGDPKLMRHYLTRGKRDARFDRTVLKAIREGRPVDAAMVEKIVGRYSDGLLKLRADMIGQNETATAIGKARADAIEQQIMAGKIDARDVTKVWKHTPQENPRLHHRAMNGESVPYGQPFTLPNGVQMAYPHAPDAPASETIFCKCIYEVKIDFTARLVRERRAA